jgi:hypothetical protein
MKIAIFPICKLFLVAFLLFTICPTERWKSGLGPTGWGPWRLLLSHFLLAAPTGYELVSRYGKLPFLQWLLPAVFVIFANFAMILPESILNIPGSSCFIRTITAVCGCFWVFLGLGSSQRNFYRPWAGIAAFALAGVPPTIYAWKLGSASERDSISMADAGRVIAESTAILTMLDCGWLDSIAKSNANSRLEKLSREVRILNNALRQPRTTGLDQGVIFARLDRRNESMAALQGSKEPLAQLLLARLLRESGKLAESESIYMKMKDSADQGVALLATQGLAETINEAGRPAEASMVMEFAAERYIDHRAKFLKLAGSMAAESGLGAKALELWAKAEAIDSSLGGEIQRLRNRLLANFPTCLNKIFSPLR